MNDASFFIHPVLDWQRRYEALRASFVDRLPARIVAQRFHYAPQYVRLLRHLFTSGKLDFSKPVPEGLASRRRVDAAAREKIKTYRTHQLSAGDIVECLSDEGTEISVRTVERVLREEGFPRLPRRARLKIKMTVKGTHIPEKSKSLSVQDLEGQQILSSSAGIFLFAPFLAQLDLDPILQSAGLPGSQIIPAKSYLLSFLALKLGGKIWGQIFILDSAAKPPGLGTGKSVQKMYLE